MIDELTASASEERDYDALVDSVEEFILSQPAPLQDMVLEHTFTPGLYIRTLFITKGALLTSFTHKTEHPFVIRSGLIEVRLHDHVELLQTGHMGITYPGTRRVLFAHEDTVWTTFHVTNETDVEKIEATILAPHKNKDLFLRLKAEKRCYIHDHLVSNPNT